MATGIVIANVSQALGHSFFSAVVDYATSTERQPKLWVFGPAHARGNKIKPGPCDGNGNWTGCYIGAWSSTDLINWSHASKAVPLPDHHASFNTRTTLVTAAAAVDSSSSGGSSGDVRNVLPPHQAVMVLEPRNDYAFKNESFRYHLLSTTCTISSLAACMALPSFRTSVHLYPCADTCVCTVSLLTAAFPRAVCLQ